MEDIRLQILQITQGAAALPIILVMGEMEGRKAEVQDFQQQAAAVVQRVDQVQPRQVAAEFQAREELRTNHRQGNGLEILELISSGQAAADQVRHTTQAQANQAQTVAAVVGLTEMADFLEAAAVDTAEAETEAW